jgi:hypothetical protein
LLATLSFSFLPKKVETLTNRPIRFVDVKRCQPGRMNQDVKFVCQLFRGCLLLLNCDVIRVLGFELFVNASTFFVEKQNAILKRYEMKNRRKRLPLSTDTIYYCIVVRKNKGIENKNA